MQSVHVNQKREEKPDKDLPVIRRQVKPEKLEHKNTAESDTPLYLQEEEQEPVEPEAEEKPVEDSGLDLQRQPDEEEAEESTETSVEEEPESFENSGVQAKLTIGAPNDEYEQEADQVSDKVMRTPADQIAQPFAEDEDEEEQENPVSDVQTKSLTPPYLQRLCPECEPQSSQSSRVQAKSKVANKKNFIRLTGLCSQ